MLTWWEPELGEEEARAAAAVVRSGYINEGPKTRELAERLQELLGVKHVLATCNGTVALFLALKACGVEFGDEVVVPDLTFIATASAAAMCGARAVLADVRPADLTIDPDDAARRVGPKTRAIVAVHVNGRPADMQALRRIAAERQVALIEDASQALGSCWDGRALGAMGDVSAISLAPTKVITSGQGGLVATDRDDIRDRAVELKDHGRLSRSWNRHPQIGFNLKYSDILAAVACAQLDRLPQRLEILKRHYRLYREGLRDAPGVRWIATDLQRGTAPLWVDALVDDAPGLIAFLAERQIECRPFWPAVHAQPPYRQEGDFPASSYASAHGVWLPSGAGKTDADIACVIAAVREFAGGWRGAAHS